MKFLMNQLLDMVYPIRCPVCRQPVKDRRRMICPECRKKLREAEEPYCVKCGKPLHSETQEFCLDCYGKAREFEAGRAAFCYEGVMRKIIFDIKAENTWIYLRILGEEMAEALNGQVLVWKPELLIPVPMYPQKERYRGFNQAEKLAAHLSKCWNIPWDKAVRKWKDTGDQKKLTKEERRQNLKKAFKVSKGKHLPEVVLIVDDVYTTGSTVEAIAAVCRKAGAKKVYFVTLCIGRGSS